MWVKPLLLALCLVAPTAAPARHPFYDEKGEHIVDCVLEQNVPPDMLPPLDDMWKEIQTVTKKTKKPRPTFCFNEQPLPDGEGWLLLGYNNISKNEVLIALPPDHPLLRCVILHEMLHNFLGIHTPKNAHEFVERLEKLGC